MTSSPRGWLPQIGRCAWLALGMNTLSCLGSGLTMPFLIVYLHSVRGIQLPVTGLILAAIGIAGIVSTPLTGPLIDRFGALRTFTAGLLLGGAAIAGFILATSPQRAVAAAILYGIASGLMWNGFATLLAQLVPAAERGSVFALRYMSANVAFGAGALVTGLVTVSRAPGPFVAVLAADALSYLLFASVLLAVGRTLTGVPGPRDNAPGPGGRIGYRLVLRDRALLGALLVNSLLMVFALSQTNSAFPAWVTGGGHGSTRVVGLAFIINITVLLLAQLPVIRFSRGRSRTRGAAAAALLFAAAWLVLVLPASAGPDQRLGPGPAARPV
jgi:MFS family permease